MSISLKLKNNGFECLGLRLRRVRGHISRHQTVGTRLIEYQAAQSASELSRLIRQCMPKSITENWNIIGCEVDHGELEHNWLRSQSRNPLDSQANVRMRSFM